MKAPPVVCNLVQRFEANQAVYTELSYYKRRLQNDFISPFFEVLGWEFESSYYELAGDVVQHDKLTTDKAQLADYSFHDDDGVCRFLVAVKKPAVAISVDPIPALLLRTAAREAGVPMCVLTNFDELVVYDGTQAIRDDDTPVTARLFHCKYTDYLNRWDEIVRLLGKEKLSLHVA